MEGFSINVRSNADAVVMELMAAAQEMRDTAIARALNKLADQVKVAASREIRAAGYSLKAAVIKKALQVRRASSSNLRAAVIATGRPIPLIEYSARETSRGVTVNVKQGRKLIAGAFIARMPSGHVGVFVREPGGRHKKKMTGSKASWHQLPIRELFGPSVPDGLANEAVQATLQEMVMEKFPAILEHEHTWLARRTGKR